MNLFIAIWSLRLALAGTLLVGGVSFATGATPVKAIDRALVAAFSLTLFGQLLVGWLEPTDTRLARRRAQAAARPSRSARPAPGSPTSVRAAARRQMATPAGTR